MRNFESARRLLAHGSAALSHGGAYDTHPMEEDRILLLSALQASGLARECSRLTFSSEEAAAAAGAEAAASSLADLERWQPCCRSQRFASSAVWGVWQALESREGHSSVGDAEGAPGESEAPTGRVSHVAESPAKRL